MADFFNYDNKFSAFMNKTVSIVFVSVLWVIWCVPIVTAGASTTAMYYTVNKVIRHNRSYVFREFWSSFKGNFKQATIIWLIMLGLGIVFGVDLYIMHTLYENGVEAGKMYPLFVVFLVLEFIWGVFAFANLARFENTTKAIMKNAALMMIAHFPWMLLMIVILAVTILLLVIAPILIFLLPAVYMLLCNLILEKIFVHYMSEESKQEEEERNREYFG